MNASNVLVELSNGAVLEIKYHKDSKIGYISEESNFVYMFYEFHNVWFETIEQACKHIESYYCKSITYVC